MITCIANSRQCKYTFTMDRHSIVISFDRFNRHAVIQRVCRLLTDHMRRIGIYQYNCECNELTTTLFFRLKALIDCATGMRQPKTRQLMEGSQLA